MFKETVIMFFVLFLMPVAVFADVNTAYENLDLELITTTIIEIETDEEWYALELDGYFTFYITNEHQRNLNSIMNIGYTWLSYSDLHIVIRNNGIRSVSVEIDIRANLSRHGIQTLLFTRHLLGFGVSNDTMRGAWPVQSAMITAIARDSTGGFGHLSAWSRPNPFFVDTLSKDVYYLY